MPSPEWPDKDPAEVLWYGFNWTPKRLGQSSIASVVADVDVGDVSVLQSVGNTRVTGSREGQGSLHLLSGGTTDTDCEIVLTATTDDVPALVLVQRVYIRVETQ